MAAARARALPRRFGAAGDRGRRSPLRRAAQRHPPPRRPDRPRAARQARVSAARRRHRPHVRTHRTTFFDRHVTGDPPWFVPFQCDSEYPVGPTRRWVRGGGGVLTVKSPRARSSTCSTRSRRWASRSASRSTSASVPCWPPRSSRCAASRSSRRPTGTKIARSSGTGSTRSTCGSALSHCGDVAPRSRRGRTRRMPEIAPTGTEGAWFDWSVGRPVVERVAGHADRAAGVRGR